MKVDEVCRVEPLLGAALREPTLWELSKSECSKSLKAHSLKMCQHHNRAAE